MGQYATEISKKLLKQNVNTQRRLENLRKCSTQVLRRLTPCSESLTRISLLKTPSRTNSYWRALRRMHRKQRRLVNCFRIMELCSRGRRRSSLRVNLFWVSPQQRVDEGAGDREDGVAVGEDEADNGQAECGQEGIRGWEQQNGGGADGDQELASGSHELRKGLILQTTSYLWPYKIIL